MARNRTLSEQLGQLFALLPPEAGCIIRVLYSPPDWNDRPAPVAVPGRRFKTIPLPHDDTHQLTLSLRGGLRRSITVIPPDTPIQNAEELLAVVNGRDDRPAPRRDDQPAWDSAGGHL